MKMMWGGERSAKNRELFFVFDAKGEADELLLCAADFYRVFLDGRFVSYGPDRTAAGYARPRRVDVRGVRQIAVAVTAYNVSCYACDEQLPYFGAEVFAGGKRIAESQDFRCYHSSAKRENVLRYGFQRGFVELYDLRSVRYKQFETYEAEPVTLLHEQRDRAEYVEIPFAYTGEGGPLDGAEPPFWLQREGFAPEKGELTFDDLMKLTEGCRAYDFVLPSVEAGFIRLNVTAKADARVLVCFQETIPNGKWVPGRTSCCDIAGWELPAGEHTVTTAEPYSMKYLRVFVKGEAEISPSLVTCRNGDKFLLHAEGDERICAVLRAAEKTFRHNAVDVFTDCPGRERAGWLCDSYFTAQTERLLTGGNEIEHNFLENILLARTEELEKGMLPMCFPSQHADGRFIPNWAMWFVIELRDYFARTKDGDLVALAREKVYALADYFKEFENEEGLLEDLRSWVFVEWSVANDEDYVKGVNFPTNMLYARMLDCMAQLYHDKPLAVKAEKLRKCIYARSFNGTFYTDNAVREGGNLTRCEGHISETCQYYALFCDLPADDVFRRRMAEQFGPFRAPDVFPEVGRSNAFIGNFLRFFWLCGEGEYSRVMGEMLDYFYAMAKETGTLWEHNDPSASCDHGFASAAAVLIVRCLTGYRTVENGKFVFDEAFVPQKKYGVTLTFGEGESAVQKQC